MNLPEKNLKKRLRVMTVLGTRPEIIRLSRVIAKLDRYTNHVLIHTGQNYDFELSEIFFQQLGISKPKRVLQCAKKNAVETVAAILSETDALLEEFQPDALLVLGDTNSCLAAYSAKRRKIPVFHMEAGNRCRDQRVPEEINRKVIDHLADINMPYSELARQNLVAEGLPPDRVIKTGSPMKEILDHHAKEILASAVLKQLSLKPLDYYVASFHREEHVDNPRNLAELVKTVNELAEREGKKVIVSCHPRTQKRLEKIQAAWHTKVQILKPLGFTDYLKLQTNAIAVLSDSGTITEESAILNFPAINLRESHERPEGMDEASVMLTGFKSDRVAQGLEILKDQPRGSDRLLKMPSDYNVDNVSDKVVRIILSYTDYVNRQVWRIA